MKMHQQTNRRPLVIWGAFVAAMTLVGGLLIITDPSPAPKVGSFYIADFTNLPLGNIFETSTPIKHDLWTNIVIHHSGRSFGSSESIAKEHQDIGLKGLGYHFIIGNGNGMDDGSLHVGYRWNYQIPGSQNVFESDNNNNNNHTINICVVGNGNKHQFSDRQINRLRTLVIGLQRELGITIDNVSLYSDLYESSFSPGKFFPTDFNEQLAYPSSDGI